MARRPKKPRTVFKKRRNVGVPKAKVLADLKIKEYEKGLRKKTNKFNTNKNLQTDKVEETISANDGREENLSNETSVFIKQEALEPDAETEMASEKSGSFETVYLGSNNYQYENEETAIIKVEQANDPEVEEIKLELHPDIIKSEPLDIIDEETGTSERCPECGEEVWNLECHIKEQHPKTEVTKIQTTKPKQRPSKKIKLSPPPSQTVSTSSTCTQVKVAPLLVSSKNPTSKQYLVLVPQTAEAPSPPPPPPSNTSYLSCTTDSSGTFSVSLDEFPESDRVVIKRKMLEVVETVKRLKINPEMILIARKAEIS